MSDSTQKMGCKEGCHEEFKRSNFLLSGVQPKLFITSEWEAACGGCHLWYVLWRVMWVLLFVTLVILDWTVDYGRYASEDEKIKWFIYLLSWSLIVSTLEVTLSAITSIHGYRKHKIAGSFDYAIPEMTWYLKLQWVLHNVAIMAAIIDTLLYWVILYLPEPFELHWMKIVLHGPNTAYYLINMFITGTPLRIYHAWHSVVFAILFSLFTLAYELLGQTNTSGYNGVYEILAWRENPGLTVGYILGFLLLDVVIWLFLYALYRLRIAISCEMMKSCPHATTGRAMIIHTHTADVNVKKQKKVVAKKPKAAKSWKVNDQHVSVVNVY